MCCGCEEKDETVCTQDVKECPDGSFVSRVPPNCEFEECVESECDYNEEGMRYVHKDGNVCPLADFRCERNEEHFTNECGCGCKLKEIIAAPDQIFCKDEERNVDACIELYDPVCGWFSDNIQCIKFPCAQDYSNSCFACTNPDVEYYTSGKCPS